MCCGMFGEIVSQIVTAFAPIYIELALMDPVTHPMVSHIKCFRAFWFDCAVRYSLCTFVICLHSTTTENASRNIPNTVCGLVGTFLISAKMFLIPCVLWAISGTISNMFLIPNNIRNTLSCSWYYYVESFYNVPNMAMPILILW